MTAAGTCQRCGLGAQPYYQLPPAPVIHQLGCIYPPTSEKTCESPICPRKNHFRAVGHTTLRSAP